MSPVVRLALDLVLPLARESANVPAHPSAPRLDPGIGLDWAIARGSVMSVDRAWATGQGNVLRRPAPAIALGSVMAIGRAWVTARRSGLRRRVTVIDLATGQDNFLRGPAMAIGRADQSVPMAPTDRGFLADQSVRIDRASPMAPTDQDFLAVPIDQAYRIDQADPTGVRTAPAGQAALIDQGSRIAPGVQIGLPSTSTGRTSTTTFSIVTRTSTPVLSTLAGGDTIVPLTCPIGIATITAATGGDGPQRVR